MTQETVQEMMDMDLPQVQNHLHLLQSINTCCVIFAGNSG